MSLGTGRAGQQRAAAASPERLPKALRRARGKKQQPDGGEGRRRMVGYMQRLLGQDLHRPDDKGNFKARG